MLFSCDTIHVSHSLLSDSMNDPEQQIPGQILQVATVITVFNAIK